MAISQNPVIYNETVNFDDLLDKACERLWEKHSLHCIQRIIDMDNELEKLGRELDDFMAAAGR